MEYENKCMQGGLTGSLVDGFLENNAWFLTRFVNNFLLGNESAV